MKRIIVVIVAVAAIFTSCTSPEKKAQKLIKERLKETLHDYKSYEPVNFSGLDSNFTDVFSDTAYSNYADIVIYYSKSLDEYEEKADRYRGRSYFESEYSVALSMAKWCRDSLIHYLEICKEIEKDFVPEFIGWKMTHKFRANNGNGALRLGENRYYFDKDVTKVLRTEDLDKD